MRVLLDTNVWQYLVEREAVNELRRVTPERGWQAPFKLARPVRVRPVPTIVKEITTEVEAVGIGSP